MDFIGHWPRFAATALFHLPEPWRSNEFVEEAERRGVLLTASDPFTVGRESSHAVRISFGRPHDNDDLVKILVIIAALLREGPSYSFGGVV